MKPDHLEGSVKFFGVLQLTCDSIKIIPGSEQEAGDSDAQVALLPPQPLADQAEGCTALSPTLSSSPSPVGKLHGFS